MRLSLRAGERVYINGAVLRVDRKVSIELMNDASFLLETHVLQADEATTPLRQLYFAAQTILIDPSGADRARALCRSLQAGLLAAVTDGVIRDGVTCAGALIAADRLIEALKLIRGLYPAEAALLGKSARADAARPTIAPSPREPSPTHPA